MDKFLSKYQCGFRKGYNAQHCHLAMIEKWKKSMDNGNEFGALLANLSKAFDCLSHDLIIAKLNSYGFNLTALNLIHNCLLFFLSGFFFTDIHESQDCRGRGRTFL